MKRNPIVPKNGIIRERGHHEFVYRRRKYGYQSWILTVVRLQRLVINGVLDDLQCPYEAEVNLLLTDG